MERNVKRARLNETSTWRETMTPVNPTDGVWMLPGFGNTGVVETLQGLVLIDVPVVRLMDRMMKWLREVSSAPVHTVFLTHGHLDHAAALEPLFDEAAKNGHPPPRIVAQRNLPQRFSRYRMLDEFHDHINRIQFATPEGVQAFQLPERNPDITFDQSFSTSVGDIDFHAFHQKGETDDGLWIWVPEKKAVFCGDLIIAGMPNVGNPFKVQRP